MNFEPFNLQDHVDRLTPTKEKGKYYCPACGGHNLSFGPKGFTCYSNYCSFEEIKKAMGLWEENGNGSHFEAKPKPKRKPSPREREKVAQAESVRIESKVDDLWRMVLSDYHTIEQAAIELEQWCKVEGHNAYNAGQLLKAKHREATALKADAGGVLEEQDLEQFRRSLELRASAASFDIATILPKGLAAAIKNDARVLNVGADGFLCYLLPLALSLLPRQARITTPDDAFSEPPVLFSAVLGDSGSGKTRIEKACSAWFHKRQEEARARYEQEIADYERQVAEIKREEQKRKKDDSGPTREMPRPPRERKFIFNVATPEAVARKLGYQARGSVWMRGELKGLLGGIDQYKSKGDGTELILEYWDAGGKAVDRVDEANSFYAAEGNLSIVGGIQGKAFASAFTDIDDAQGLAARFLFCQVPTLPMQRVAGSRELPSILADIWSRINQLGHPFFTLDPAADSLFTDCFGQFEELAIAAQYEAVRAWCRKLPGQLLRVSAAIHLISWAYGEEDDPCQIGPTAVLAGWQWLTHCHDSFTLLQDQMRGYSPSALMAAILDLARQSPDGVSLRDIYAIHLKAQLKKAGDPLGKLPADLVREICQELESNGYGCIRRVGKSDRFYARGDDE